MSGFSKACTPCRQRKIKCDAAVNGLPCGCCVRRGCQERCFQPSRKRREVKSKFAKAESSGSPGLSSHASHRTLQAKDTSRPLSCGDGSQSALAVVHLPRPKFSVLNTSLEHLDECRDPAGYQAGMHYLNILAELDGGKSHLADLMKDSPLTLEYADKSHNRQNCLRRPDGRIPHPDPVDDAYLVRKGVFDLPPRHCVDAILKAYFEFVYPYAPILDRLDWVKGFRLGSYSLFLMHALLASGTLYAPMNVISECGFESRAAAQESFCLKATLLHDFQYETSPVHNIQGSLILGAVISSHRSEKDFHYWFYNAVRLMETVDPCQENGEDKDQKAVKLFRRMWWTLYCRDVLISYVGSGRMGFLNLGHRDCSISPLTENDWENEDHSPSTDIFLPPLTRRQKTTFIQYCNLSVAASQCLSAVRSQSQDDPKNVMSPLDTWRKSLREELRTDDTSVQYDMCHSFLLASNYRFECILLRLLRISWQPRDLDRSLWAKSRLRSAMFELDTIAGRMLTNSMLASVPLSFTTCIPVLLSLHIESVLDPSESEVTRSISRISISQTMLVLQNLSQIPAIKQMIAVFETVLARNNLTPPTFDVSLSHHAHAQQGIERSEAWRGGFNAAMWQDTSEFYSFPYGDMFKLDFLDN